MKVLYSLVVQPELRGMTRSMNPSSSSRSFLAPLQLGVLLVEPDQDLRASRALLLASSDYLVATAGNHGEIFDLSLTTRIHLAVLSDTLGRSGLCSAAEYVRAQWPSARILVLGTPQFVLEDYLYDEAVNHGLPPEKLLDMLARLSENLLNQKTKDIGFRFRPLVISHPHQSFARHDEDRMLCTET